MPSVPVLFIKSVGVIIASCWTKAAAAGKGQPLKIAGYMPAFSFWSHLINTFQANHRLPLTHSLRLSPRAPLTLFSTSVSLLPSVSLFPLSDYHSMSETAELILTSMWCRWPAKLQTNTYELTKSASEGQKSFHLLPSVTLFSIFGTAHSQHTDRCDCTCLSYECDFSPLIWTTLLGLHFSQISETRLDKKIKL